MSRFTLIVALVGIALSGCKKDTGPVLEIPCSQNVASLRYGAGATFVANCPEGCAESAKVWGDGLYTKDSPICKAAIHAGVIGKNGGKIKVTVQPGQDAYKGSTKNGITTEKYGSFGGSYTIDDP